MIYRPVHRPTNGWTRLVNDSFLLRMPRPQGRSDGGYIGIYAPSQKNQSTLQIFMWLLVVFFLFDPGQIPYRASVCLSSCFFYLLTHHNDVINDVTVGVIHCYKRPVFSSPTRT